MDPLIATIWRDVLGLPSDLNCPVIAAPIALPICGGINPVLDAGPGKDINNPNAVAIFSMVYKQTHSLANPCTVGEFYYQSATKIAPPLSGFKGTGGQYFFPVIQEAIQPIKTAAGWAAVGWAAAKFGGFVDSVSKPLLTLGDWIYDPFNNIHAAKNICNKAESW